MRRKFLIIGDVQKLNNGDLVFGVNTSNLTLREEWKNKTIDEVKDLFLVKKLQIIGKGVKITEEILDVVVNSSLTEYKTIFIKMEGSLEMLKIISITKLEKMQESKSAKIGFILMQISLLVFW